MLTTSIPNHLQYFFKGSGNLDSTRYTEEIHQLYSTLIREFFASERELKMFNSIPGNYIGLMKKINNYAQINNLHRNESGRNNIITDTFLSTLCFPGKNRSAKNWTKGRDKQKLIATYLFLVNYPPIKNKGNEGYWINKALTQTYKAPLEDVELVNFILEYTNFERVSLPKRGSSSADRMYNGYPITFEDILADYDFQRCVLTRKNGIQDVLKKHIDGSESTFILIKGNAGTGKSVLLKRIGLEMCQSRRNVFMLSEAWVENRQGSIHSQIVQIFNLLPNNCTLIIDGIAECLFKDEINFKSLLETLRGKKVLFVFSEQTNRWNKVENKANRLVSDARFFPFTLEPLNETECLALVDKLIELEAKNKILPKKILVTREKRLSICANSTNGHLLIILLQTRYGKNFSEVIVEEYEGIPSDIGKSAYLNICFWHNLKISVPENLFISSMNFKTPLDIIDFNKSTEGLIYRQKNGELTSRHILVAKVISNKFINESFLKFHFLMKIFSVKNENNLMKNFLLKCFYKDDFAKIIVNDLKKDENLISQIISVIDNQPIMTETKIKTELLLFKAIVKISLNYPEEALLIYKFIIEKIDKNRHYCYRQMAWIELRRKNFDQSAKYAISSYPIALDNSTKIIEIARILASGNWENFKKAHFYYEKAVQKAKRKKKYIQEFQNYKRALQAANRIENLSEKDIIPADVFKILKPRLTFIKNYFGEDSVEYKERIVEEFHLVSANSDGSLDDYNKIVDGCNFEDDDLMNSISQSNLARLKFIEWRENFGVTDASEISDLLHKSITLNFDNPFAHTWLGTYYKEVKNNYFEAEAEYRLALDLSKDAKHKFDRDHPIFPNNLGLLIMDKVLLGHQDRSALYDAQELFVQSVIMDEAKGSKFYWAKRNLEKCKAFIASYGQV